MVTLTRYFAIADFRERYKRLHTSTLQRPFQNTSQVPLSRSPIYPLVVSDCKALMTPPDHKKNKQLPLPASHRKTPHNNYHTDNSPRHHRHQRLMCKKIRIELNRV